MTQNTEYQLFIFVKFCDFVFLPAGRQVCG